MTRLIILLAILSMTTLPIHAQVLVTVGDRSVTSEQLEKAIRSAPFATQFPTLDEDEQARLRGDMLQRLVNFELLSLEAERLQLDRLPEFQMELQAFETGLLSQRYLQRLRETIEIPQALQAQWREKFGTDLDAMSAARALTISRYYQILKSKRLTDLRKEYGDLDETELWAKAAQRDGIGVEDQIEGFRQELMVQKLLQTKEKEWIPDETVLRDYYQTHPEIGYVPERRHVGQIVVDSRELAHTLRQRVLAGESLFKLAAEYSIDPYGREHGGDMGWLKEGEGMPELERALASLSDNTVSEVIETPKGFHLLMIVDRRPGEQKRFTAIKDRVRRALLAEKLPSYMESLQERFPLQWHMADRLP